MRLWKTPSRLRRISPLLFIALPLIFLSSLLARRMPWWRWDIQEEWRYWAGGLCGALVIYLGLRRTHRWAPALLTLSAGVYTLGCLMLSIRQENVMLGLFSVFFGIFAFGYLDRLWAAYQTPSISPGMGWFQSSPETIPGLFMEWGNKSGLRLSKLDLDGGFVVGDFEKGFEKSAPAEITLIYRDARTSCSIDLISALGEKIDSSWRGVGIEFKKTDRDSKKDLSDFIEKLRGEGHISR
jgi:hypothetical protein